MTEQVPRRKFLGLVAAGGAALPALAVTGTAHARGAHAHFGTIVGTSAHSLVIDTADDTLRVTPERGARMFSGASGPVTTPAAFVPGDRVVVEGRRVGASVRATAIGSILTRDDERGMLWRHPGTGETRVAVEAR